MKARATLLRMDAESVEDFFAPFARVRAKRMFSGHGRNKKKTKETRKKRRKKKEVRENQKKRNKKIKRKKYNK